jgi:hypothetical protein
LNQSVVSIRPASSSSSARRSRAFPARPARLRLPAAAVASCQCSSARSALIASTYASIEAAMMFVEVISPV